MRKLLKYQLMNYRGLDMKVFLGILLFVTLLGWLSHQLFNVTAGMILTIIAIFYVGVLSGGICIHYTSYIHLNTKVGSLPLLIPLPHLWSLLAALLASLAAGAATATSYFALLLAFRQQPGIQWLDGWQWLMLAGMYILAQSIYVCQLAVAGTLKGRLVLPKKLRFLRKLAWWITNETSVMNSAFWVAVVIIPLHSRVFQEHIAVSRSLLALIVFASSALLLYAAACLLEKYSNY